MAENEKWLLCPLQDENVTELVLPRRNVAYLRKISKSVLETTGLLYGVVKGESLYFLEGTVLGVGSPTRCEFDPAYRKFHDGFIKRAYEVQPVLVSILYQ